MSLPRYISLLKNVKAVALLDPAHFPEGETSWLVRRFRYRSVGVSLRSMEKTLNTAKLRRKPFVELPFPIAEAERLCALIAALHNIPGYVVEPVTLASCYVAPLILLSRRAVGLVEPLTVWSVHSMAPLPDVEVKRN